jgi:large subunit ribosomal protein L21
MYAVFEDGSRQYLVEEGDVVRVDFREAEVGDEIEFGRVLLYQNEADTRIGQPVVEGARVLGEVLDHPSVKLYIQKFRRRKNSKRLRGHRQYYTKVLIDAILLPGQERPTREEEEEDQDVEGQDEQGQDEEGQEEEQAPQS